MRLVELVFKGTNTSAVRSLEGIAAASNKTRDAVVAGQDASAASMRRTEERTATLRASMGSLAGIVGLGGVAFGLKDVFQGGMKLQAQQALLQQALKSTGMASASTQARLEGTAKALSEHGGFSNEQNIAALTAFVRETHSASAAQRDLSLATDIARSRGIDLAQAQTVVQRAQGGSIGRLQALLGPMVAVKEASHELSKAHVEETMRLQAQSKAYGAGASAWLKQAELQHGITTQEAAAAAIMDKHATATEVLTKAQEAFGGSAAAYSKTAAGHLSNLRNTIKNLVDELGVGLMPALKIVLGGLTAFIGVIAHNKVLLYTLTGAVLLLTAAWVKAKIVAGAMLVWKELGGIWTVLTGVLTRLGLSTSAFGAEAEAAGAQLELFGGSADAADAQLSLFAGATERAMGPTAALTAENEALAASFDAVAGSATAAGAAETGAAAGAGEAGAAGAAGLGAKGLLGLAAGPPGLVLAGLGIGGYEMIKHSKAIDKFFGVGHAKHRVTRTIGTHAPYGVPIGNHHAAGGVIESPVGYAAGGVIRHKPKQRPAHFDFGGPVGSDTVPAWLTPGEGILTTAAMSAIGGASALNAMNAGHPAQNIVIHPSTAVLRLDGRTVAEAVIRYVIDRSARGPTSMTGGSLVLGTPGLPATGALRLRSP